MNNMYEDVKRELAQAKSEQKELRTVNTEFHALCVQASIEWTQNDQTVEIGAVLKRPRNQRHPPFSLSGWEPYIYILK